MLHNQDFYMYLKTLLDTYKQYGKLNLFCWCAPKRCHAKIIKEVIENNDEILRRATFQ